MVIFQKPSKSVLIIDRKFKVEAERMFSDVGIKVVSGHRFIGEDDECELYVKQKIEKWVRCVAGLSKAAESQPQAAFAALVKSIQCEWRFLQRVIPNCSILFSPLSDITCIKEKFLPSIFGSTVSDIEFDLFTLPTRLAGLGLGDPVKRVTNIFQLSRMASDLILKSRKDCLPFSVADHNQHFHRTSN